MKPSSTDPSLVEILKTRPSLTESEAAAYTNVSVSFLRKAREGNLPDSAPPAPAYIKIGRSVRYLRDDLDQWLQKFPKQLNSAVESS